MPPQSFDPLKYQNDMKAKAESNGRWNATQGNKADLELCSSLMLIDTVALTATVILVSNDRVVQKLGVAIIVLLIIASVSVVFSIFSGVVNYIAIMRFQERWSQVHARIASQFSSGPLAPADMNLIATREVANIPGKSSQVFWYSQIIFLSTALILYLAIVIGALAEKL